jgi:hypothetical protein
MTSAKVKLEDALGEMQSLLTALQMAASDIEPAIHACAIGVLAEQIGLRLRAVLNIIDDLEEPANARDR